MASSPPTTPTPHQQLEASLRSKGEDSQHSSPRLSGLPYSDQEARTSSPKTLLVSSRNGTSQRSYGTVKQSLSASFKKSEVSFIQHTVLETDTLQGLALKYNVAVEDIQRLNGIWSTDSMHCKNTLKIPITSHSNTSSHTNSPNRSPILKRSMDKKTSTSSVGSIPNGAHLEDEKESSGEEVRSKFSVRQQKSKLSTSTCSEDGVKNILDILNCADEQLATSRIFAEKLAARSATLSVPQDAYHRTHEDVHRQRSSTNPSRASSEREHSPKAPRRLHLKRVSTTPEKLEASRDELEEKLFEL